jgi:hypothetical protein
MSVAIHSSKETGFVDHTSPLYAENGNIKGHKCVSSGCYEFRSITEVSLVGHIFSNSHPCPASVAVVENKNLIY